MYSTSRPEASSLPARSAIDVARLTDVALLGPCSQQQVTGRLHGFIDQGVGELLSLVEDGHSLVSRVFHGICPSLLERGASLLELTA
jgi:hypothetical protein